MRQGSQRGAWFRPSRWKRRTERSSFRTSGLALCGGPRRCRLPGLPTGLAGRVPLGRRRARDQAGTPLVARAGANLVRHPRHAAVLSPAAQRVLVPAPALGRHDAGIPSRQYRPALPGGISRFVGTAAPESTRRVLGGGDLRLAPGASRIGGLDYGTEEHAFGRVLLGRHAELSALRRAAEQHLLCVGPGPVRAGPVDQDGDGHAARRAVGDLLVAARPALVERRRAAAGALLCPGRRGGTAHGLDRARARSAHRGPNMPLPSSSAA